MEIGSITAAALLIWSVAVAIGDWRSHRIPNTLLLVVLIPELLVMAWTGRGLLGSEPLASLAGFLIAASVFVPGFLMRLSGGGDVKLAACCGLVLGMPDVLVMLVVAAILLGLVSGWVLIRRQSSTQRGARLAAGPALVAGFVSAVGLHLARNAL